MAGSLKDWRIDALFTEEEISRVITEALQLRRSHPGSFIILSVGHEPAGIQELKEDCWHDGRWGFPDHELALGHLMSMREALIQQELGSPRGSTT